MTPEREPTATVVLAEVRAILLRVMAVDTGWPYDQCAAVLDTASADLAAALTTAAARVREEAVEAVVSYLLGWADDRGGTDEKILRDVASMLPSALLPTPTPEPPR